MDEPDDWQADWSSNRRRKFLLGLRMSPVERLRWLEEALRIAHASGALARRRMQDPDRHGRWDDVVPR